MCAELDLENITHLFYANFVYDYLMHKLYYKFTRKVKINVNRRKSVWVSEEKTRKLTAILSSRWSTMRLYPLLTSLGGR